MIFKLVGFFPQKQRKEVAKVAQFLPQNTRKQYASSFIHSYRDNTVTTSTTFVHEKFSFWGGHSPQLPFGKSKNAKENYITTSM